MEILCVNPTPSSKAWQKRDAFIVKSVAVPVLVPTAELRTLRVRFGDDLPSSSDVCYQDIGLDEALTQREAASHRAQGLEVPPVAVLGYEEGEDSEEDSKENSVDTEDFLAHEDSP
ncbi:hypothetical protein FNV43_RR21729 [Rhamnella rubrinervis]|uniref:Uncharacterized protein n=1 Tax=Rhamnella rubrinervis TaxID=2594499 RepID=A0A8K0DV64_9ROSA|nr:hypothetical protein FNV43_RR21729 [Rhamnella rubrinervis]